MVCPGGVCYNMSTVGSSTNVFDMVKGINDASDGLLVSIGMIALFIILVVTLLRFNPPAESFTASSAVLVIICLMFYSTNTLALEWVTGFGLIFAGSVTALYLINR